MKEKIDYSDIPETDKEFWADSKVMKPINTRLSKENYEFVLNMEKPFEIGLNEILDVYRKLYELAKADIEKKQKVA